MYSGKTFKQELANLKQENMNKMDILEKYQARYLLTYLHHGRIN